MFGAVEDEVVMLQAAGRASSQSSDAVARLWLAGLGNRDKVAAREDAGLGAGVWRWGSAKRRSWWRWELKVEKGKQWRRGGGEPGDGRRLLVS